MFDVQRSVVREVAVGEGVNEDTIGPLRMELRALADRYGVDAAPSRLAGLDRAILARRRRARRLRAEIDDLTADLRAVEAEVIGFERAVEAVLADEIDRIRLEQREGWSPVPVLGFRYWLIAGDGMRGFRSRWPTPTLTAVCATTGNADDVPHSDGRCGRLGCGVYAAKGLEPLTAELDEMPLGGYAVGLVGLSGKVVEHQRGYRGARATVVAVAATSGGRLALTSDAAAIDALFTAPQASLHAAAVRDRREIPAHIARYLATEYEERRSTWTSVSRSA